MCDDEARYQKPHTNEHARSGGQTVNSETFAGSELDCRYMIALTGTNTGFVGVEGSCGEYEQYPRLYEKKKRRATA